ncbi:hypothetical protein CIHG_07310 [Coccidioides immitis H538.4]|uniref:Uncharacterized protein n=3 Tax=Coccidioides immitis TaxID=5501 RepID=A0A0J8QX86_COCIT|nr:hypothetical protein CIRG_00644 [Coccidioides immitis RMSCC 2394]KMU75978.1 hypothetical protein CISG_05462 [Coccidioides immitis RMSCC 3703]KMU89502.1 hypothetical protein CIHG_07310 [Coccidioides immitis H538.4]
MDEAVGLVLEINVSLGVTVGDACNHMQPTTSTCFLIWDHGDHRRMDTSSYLSLAFLVGSAQIFIVRRRPGIHGTRLQEDQWLLGPTTRKNRSVPERCLAIKTCRRFISPESEEGSAGGLAVFKINWRVPDC